MVLDLAPQLRHPWQRALYRLTGPVVDRSLALRSFRMTYHSTREVYARHPAAPSLFAFFDSALVALDARVEAESVKAATGLRSVSGSQPAPRLPGSGPLVVVCNHPFGMFDPVALGWWVARQRADVRILANGLLAAMPELAPWLIRVDPFGGPGSRGRNTAPIRDALRHLQRGGVLLVFPAGEVAHYQPGHGIAEAPWSPHVGALIQRSGAAVLPVHVGGRNSLLFQAAGLVHPRLRTGLLLRELKRHHRRTLRLQVGAVLPPARLARFDDPETLTRSLRLTTLMLGRRRQARGDSGPRLSGRSTLTLPPLPPQVRDGSPADPARQPVDDHHTSTPRARWFRRADQPLAPPGPVESILRDVERLRAAGGLLACQGKMAVFCGVASQLPAVLPEIGRLRELTFRQVGEGSGRALDLDRFDPHYLHLFLWDQKEQRLAGAYRIGRADELVRRHGPDALYTSTLFRFEAPFLDRLEGALELGRSFIRPEYQRDLGALPLLWRGIGRWIAAHPEYRQLFGPVSISRDYDGLSRRLIVEYLRHHRWHAELAAQVRPRRPYRYLGRRRWLREFVRADLRDVDEFSSLIATIEADGKGLPVLLKHYLKLQGTLLAFNVDKDFASVLDGLILVDLPSCDPRVLARYLGEEASREYLQRHQ